MRDDASSAQPLDPSFEVALPPDIAAGGWYLLRGHLLQRGGEHDAALYWDRGEGWSPCWRMSVAPSRKGVVLEVLHLPAGVRRVAVGAGRCAHCEAGALRLTPLGPLQRRWWMLRVVLQQMVSHGARKRRALGLQWPLVLRDLPAAYDRARRLRAHAPAPSYAEWVEYFDTLGSADRQRIAAQVAGWADAPAFEVLLLGGDAAARERSMRSLDDQLFRHFTCVTAPLPSDRHEDAGAARRRWLLPLHAGDQLAPHALYWLAATVRAHPDAALLYADEDELDATGARCRPRFKPAWSWALARESRFPGRAVAFRGDALAAAGGFSAAQAGAAIHDTVLRVMESGGRASHIPAVLLHRAHRREELADGSDEPHMEAVRAHLVRQSVAAEVLATGPGRWRVRYALPPQPPLVSIVVPTRDALALTRRCIDSLRALTRYPRYEILLVDNQSVDPAAMAWMRELAAEGALRLLPHDAPFNYSAINNRAVHAARGELICLLNNDTEIIQPDWLDEMVAQLLQPGVDVVGAKLLYPDGRVQHAGDILGAGGIANHAHAWLQADEPGYDGRALVAQEYSAVTAACMLTRKDRFLALGGLDERHLPVAFNDVDYCLRVREAGGRVVWTPHARLLHHESVSRGSDASGARRRRARREAAYMRRRWRQMLACDPFYSPNLSHERADFSLSHAPVVERPWVT